MILTFWSGKENDFSDYDVTCVCQGFRAEVRTLPYGRAS